jgi:PilZ domain
MFRTNPDPDPEGFGMSTTNDQLECLWDVLSVKRDRRAYTRSNSAGLTYVELGDANGGIAWNCSEGGMAITTAEMLIGDNFPRIRFQLPTSDVWIEAGGQVAWMDASKKGAGIKFIDIAASDREKIREWIASKDSAIDQIQEDNEDGEIDMGLSGSRSASPEKDQIAEVLSESEEKFASMFPSEKSLTNAPKSEWLAQDLSTPVMPFACDTQLNPNAQNDPNLVSDQRSGPAASNESLTHLSAEEHGSGASQISHAAVGFPLPTWQSPSASALDGKIACREFPVEAGTSAEPLLTKLSADPQELPPLFPVRGRQRHWKRHHLSPVDKVKSAFSVIASRTQFRLARLRTSTLVIYQSLIQQSSLWRTKSWNLKVPFEWSGYVRSCLQWLRARSNSRQVRHAPQKPVRPAPHNDSSVRALPSQAPQRPNHQAPDLQRSVDFTTSILHWLRQPMRTMRHRRRTSLS